MGIFLISLISATFLCSLVAGFLFAFALVAMPGIKSLSDREFIRAFQAMDRVIQNNQPVFLDNTIHRLEGSDRVIQNNQPVFLVVWVGSIVALVTSSVLGIGLLDGAGRLLILLAAVAYLLGVQLPTFTINIPLNNKLQSLDVDAMDESERKAARKDFEPRWNRWNAIRTVCASLASVLLMSLLFKL